MTIFTAPRLRAAVLAFGLVILSCPVPGVAQTAPDPSVENQMRILQERIEALSKELDAIQKQQLTAQRDII